MSQRMEEPKTMGECWAVFKRFGFMKPELPLDDSLFPNARLLVRMHNAHLDEIERLNKEYAEERAAHNSHVAELLRAEAGIERITKERDDHGPEGRNYTNGQYVELLLKYEAMREALEQLIEDYHRRQRSAITILDHPSTRMEQRIRVHGKKEVYRDILLELNRILPVKWEGEKP